MAYALEGFKWGAGTWGTSAYNITYSIDWSGLQSTSGFSAANYQTALDTAFTDWQNAAAISFSQVASSTPADITLTFHDLSGTTVGLANTTYAPGDPGVVHSATIQFDASATWSPDGQNSGLNFQAVALHEIGHTIGLDHVSNTTEIMYPYVTSLDHLGTGDIAGAQHIYGADAGDPAVTDPGPSAGTSTTVGAAGGGGGGGGIIMIVLGAVLALLGGIVGMGAAAASAAAGAMKLGGGHHDDPTDHHTAADSFDWAHSVHAIDLADVLPVTGTVGDEHVDAHHGLAPDPVDAQAHDFFATL